MFPHSQFVAIDVGCFEAPPVRSRRYNPLFMNKWGLLRLLRACLRVAILPTVLVLVGGFSIRGGVVLGLLLALLAFAMTDKPVARFMPYRIWISPNWYQILTDFNLIGSLDEWRSIQDSVGSSTDHYSVLRDGVQFTVVQQGGGKGPLPAFHSEIHIGWQEVGDFDAGMNEGHPPLIFWNQHRVFGTEFRFSADMTPIQLDRSGIIRKAQEPGCQPAVFFMGLHCTYTGNPRGPKYRPCVVGGLDFGIEVPEGWWEKVRDSCAAAGRVDVPNPKTGFVRLTLATLPLAELTVYRDSGDRWTNEYISKIGPQFRKRRDELREQFGWKGSGPTSIEHKYFNVEHRSI